MNIHFARRFLHSGAPHRVCVVIPHYRAVLSVPEQVSLQRCLTVLDSHPVAMVKPESLDVSRLLSDYPQLREESFADDYFKGIAGYNRLMLSDEFYARFSQYEFILIHQLDCFVFTDQLLDWCRREYDYVGAPWLPPDPIPKRVSERIASWYLRHRYRVGDVSNPEGTGANFWQYQYRSGNGGFSLRRVARIRELLQRLESRLPRYRNGGHYTHNEDIFFSIEANRYWPLLRIPGWRRALNFSWESQPALAASLCNDALPFGCHGWNKLHRDEWRVIFARCGFTLDQML